MENNRACNHWPQMERRHEEKRQDAERDGDCHQCHASENDDLIQPYLTSECHDACSKLASSKKNDCIEGNNGGDSAQPEWI